MDTKRAKQGSVNLAASIIAGFAKLYPKGSQKLTLGGGSRTMTVAEIKSELQLLVTNRANVVTAQATAKSKVDAENNQLPPLLALLSDVVELIKFTHGASAEDLAVFGVPASKTPEPQTAEEKAVTVAKRNATRKARGTMGSRQKKNVKGAITASLVVTSEAPPIAPATGTVPAAGTTSAQH